VLGLARSRARAASAVALLATIPLGLAVSAALQVAVLAAIVTAALAAGHWTRAAADDESLLH